MWRSCIVLVLAAAVAGCSSEGALGPSGVWAVVLGVAQDGGHPHLGCDRSCCQSARRDPRLAHRVACLALVDRDAGRRFLIDATPDIVDQVALLEHTCGERRGRRQNPVDGILLTHAHIGHYTGLMYLGRESMAARAVPVYGTVRMLAFLSANRPWELLIRGQHIASVELTPGAERSLTAQLHVTPLPVPHREEYSDTVAYLVRGPQKTLLWLPDVDGWDRWERRIESLAGDVDLAFLDGTFYDAGELPGRSLDEIPHPLIVQTMNRLEAAGVPKGRVHFVHLNHTNPALRRGTQARNELAARGFIVPAEGSYWRL